MNLVFSREQTEKLELAEGLALLAPDYGFCPQYEGEGIVISLRDTGSDVLSAEFAQNQAVLSFDFARRFLFFRALSVFLQEYSEGKQAFRVEESASFDAIGPMLDLSQGDMALNMATMQSLLRKQAMMGYGMCMLYMEDNFEVPEEPYFGQMRARYTYEELKAIDDYAYALGIEVIPAIQVLAHQSTVVVWDVYLPIRENRMSLLPGERKTYEFLRNVMAAATKPFRSRRMHIGMEECDHLGHGAYFKQHGMEDPGKIFLDHLLEVCKICQELDIRPMVWDERLVKLLGKGNGGPVLDLSCYDMLPPDLDMVHYEYFSKSAEWVEKRVKRRRLIDRNGLYCATVWSWLGFGPNWELTLKNAASLEGCRNAGLRGFIVSIWEIGFDCDWRANHFGLQLYAELAYKRNPSKEDFQKRFRFCCGGDYDDFMLLHDFDCVPTVPDRNNVTFPSAATEFLLWQDPLCGLFDKDIEDLNINAHFETLEKQMRECVKRAEGTEYAEMFEHYRRLADALALKSDLGNQIRKAYLAGDRAELLRLSGEVIPETRRRVSALRVHHRKCWRQCGKALGWEIYDLHYGGVLARLESAEEFLKGYLDGAITELDEVAAPRLVYKRGGFGHAGRIPAWTDKWGRMVSASMVCPEYWLGLANEPSSEAVTQN